jgi:hypothetical protein
MKDSLVSTAIYLYHILETKVRGNIIVFLHFFFTFFFFLLAMIFLFGLGNGYINK